MITGCMIQDAELKIKDEKIRSGLGGRDDNYGESELNWKGLPRFLWNLVMTVKP